MLKYTCILEHTTTHQPHIKYVFKTISKITGLPLPFGTKNENTAQLSKRRKNDEISGPKSKTFSSNFAFIVLGCPSSRFDFWLLFCKIHCVLVGRSYASIAHWWSICRLQKKYTHFVLSVAFGGFFVFYFLCEFLCLCVCVTFTAG